MNVVSRRLTRLWRSNWIKIPPEAMDDPDWLVVEKWEADEFRSEARRDWARKQDLFRSEWLQNECAVESRHLSKRLRRVRGLRKHIVIDMSMFAAYQFKRASREHKASLGWFVDQAFLVAARNRKSLRVILTGEMEDLMRNESYTPWQGAEPYSDLALAAADIAELQPVSPKVLEDLVRITSELNKEYPKEFYRMGAFPDLIGLFLSGVPSGSEHRGNFRWCFHSNEPSFSLHWMYDTGFRQGDEGGRYITTAAGSRAADYSDYLPGWTLEYDVPSITTFHVTYPAMTTILCVRRTEHDVAERLHSMAEKYLKDFCHGLIDLSLLDSLDELSSLSAPIEKIRQEHLERGRGLAVLLPSSVDTESLRLNCPVSSDVDSAIRMAVGDTSTP